MGCRATATQYRPVGRDTGRQTVPTIRSIWQPRGFRSCITIRQCLIRSFSMAATQFMAAMRSIGSADLPHMAASVCTLRTPPPFSTWYKAKVWRQRLLSFPGATRSSRAVPLRLHALIAEGRALPMTNATGVIMHGGNLLTTTATGLITDGRGLPMATLTDLNGPTITGVPSRGRHRSSIRTDPPSRGLRLPGCLKEASS